MNPSINYNDYDKHYKMQTYTHTASSHTKVSVPSYGQPTYSSYLTHAPVHTSVPHEYNTNGLSRATSYGHDFPSHTYLTSPKTLMTSDRSLQKHMSHQPTYQNPTTPKGSQLQGVLSGRKQSKGAHLAELNLEEISDVASMHTSPNNTRFAFSAPDKYGLLTPQPGIVPSAGVSFFTGLKTSQYGESKDRIMFETPHTANSTRDETSSQGTNYHMNENYGKGSSLLQGLMAPRSPNKGHIRFPEAPIGKSSSERRKDAFLNVKILNCLLQFLNCNDVIHFRGLFFEYRHDKEFRSIFKKKLEKLVLNVKTKEDQYKFWNTMVDFRKVRNDHSLAFTQHFVRKCEFIRDITKDLDRTFPEYDFFSTEKGRDGLLKVLVAISNTIKEVGYIQGLNSIAAVFLFYLKEEESFWILVYLMERVHTKDIFKSDFERVTMLNYQLETFINYYLPSIAQLFNDQQMSLSTVTTQWFITLYSYNLSIPNIAKVFNFLFIRGVPFLVQLGLAIFSKFKNNILAMSLDEIGPFLKEELRRLDDKEELLFKMALEFRVSKKLMKDLETYYKNGKPKLMLSFDARNKAVWTVLPQRDLSPTKTEITRAQTDPARVKEMKDLKKPMRTNSSSSKAKSPIFFQNIVNSLKVDLPDTIKNMFSKRESKEPTPTINNPPNSAKGSFVVQEERKPELTKSEVIEKELSSPDSQNTIERNEPDTPGSYRSTMRDYRSNTVYQKTLQSPKFQSGQFDTYMKEPPPPSVVLENKPNPYFGRPKIRPQNNSLDASDLTTFSPEKEFIKQLQMNNGKNIGDNSYKSSFVPSSTNSLYQEEQKSLYHSKSKYENGFRSPILGGPLVDNTDDLTPGSASRKVYDEYYGKKNIISPTKQADFRPRPYRSDNIDYHNSGRIGHAYPLGGDFKKIS